MPCTHTIISNFILASWLAVASSSAAEPKQLTPAEVRTLLENGRAAGALPAGLMIRVSAHLYGVSEESAKARGTTVAEDLKEAWEFTPGQLHRAVWEYDEQKKEGVYHRAESRTFDTQRLCQDLLAGKALEIERNAGTGNPVNFYGTPYCMGGRSVEVMLNGTTILNLYEACVMAGYRESNARAFAALYEKLANQARAQFKTKAK